MNKKVTIVDYGIGNILSVSRAFEYCGAQTFITHSFREISQAECLVVPGVGAFESGMVGLQKNGLIDAIKTFATLDRPFLGICLGMQLMLDISEEFGIYQGLGLIPGRVVAIPNRGHNNAIHKIPHIGWNEITPSSEAIWEDTILKNIPQKTSFYFVHSFRVMPTYAEHQLADCNYNGCTISAVIRSNFLYGCQFHPEKSGKSGLNIIKNFLNL